MSGFRPDAAVLALLPANERAIYAQDDAPFPQAGITLAGAELTELEMRLAVDEAMAARRERARIREILHRIGGCSCDRCCNRA